MTFGSSYPVVLITKIGLIQLRCINIIVLYSLLLIQHSKLLILGTELFVLRKADTGGNCSLKYSVSLILQKLRLIQSRACSYLNRFVCINDNSIALLFRITVFSSWLVRTLA